MMINKRLIGAVPESKKYIAGNVALQWCSLCANIAMMSAVTALLAALFAGEVLDVSSDIAVLDGMLSGDGLSGKNNLKLS